MLLGAFSLNSTNNVSTEVLKVPSFSKEGIMGWLKKGFESMFESIIM